MTPKISTPPALTGSTLEQLVVLQVRADLDFNLGLGFEITVGEDAFVLRTRQIPWRWATNEYDREILALVRKDADPFKWGPNVEIFTARLEDRLKRLDPPRSEKINRRPDHLDAYLRWKHAAQVCRAPEELAWRKQEFLDAIEWETLAWG